MCVCVRAMYEGGQVDLAHTIVHPRTGLVEVEHHASVESSLVAHVVAHVELGKVQHVPASGTACLWMNADGVSETKNVCTCAHSRIGEFPISSLCSISIVHERKFSKQKVTMEDYS